MFIKVNLHGIMVLTNGFETEVVRASANLVSDVFGHVFPVKVVTSA